jgi:hypothetical protein
MEEHRAIRGEIVIETIQHSGRAQDLAARLEGATDLLIALVEPCSEEQWRAICTNEERSVGVMVHHIATSVPLVLSWAELIGQGQPMLSVTMDTVNHGNAQHAAQYANPDKSATIDLLRRNTAAAADRIRGLSDEQLDRTAPFGVFGGQPVSAQMLIELIMIGHIQGYPHSHLSHIEVALRG